MGKYVKYLPLVLFLSFSFKGLVHGFALTDAPILLILGAVAAYYEFKAQDTKLDMLEAKLEELKSANEKMAKDIDNLGTSYASMKMAQGFKNVNR